MKANKKIGFVSAIALASVVGFSACSENELAEANQGERETVKTQFAISVTNKANKTRMTAGQAQEGGEFKGMKNIHLYHYDAASVSAGTETSVGLTELDAIAQNGVNGFNYGTNNTKVYNNVAITTGVKNFLFYGETAVAGNEGKTNAVWAKSLPGNYEAANKTTFSPVQIYDTNVTVGGKKNTAGKTFAEAMAQVTSRLNALYPLFNATGLPAVAVTKFQNELEGLTSASSENVREFVQDIYNAIELYKVSMNPAATGYTETETLLSNILTKMELESTGSTAGERILTYKANQDPEFPTAWGLPAGAVGLKFTDTAVPDYFSIENKSTDGMSTNYENFVFPASLFYYVNTPVAARNEAYFINGTGTGNEANWNAIAANFTDNQVLVSTRSIILKEQVQYGMASLATTVKFASGTVKDADDADVNITAGEGFEVKGVLVGNQKQVDWQFKPKTSTTGYTLYDASMTATMKPTTTATAVNYTLVYESKESTGSSDTEAQVQIAIEMVNKTGKDFRGVGKQVIPAGGTFYLVAKLDPEAPTANPKSIKSVFKQDYVTNANFTIASLANAYNVIPDLKVAALELGLSVDLGWSEGMVFEVPIP